MSEKRKSKRFYWLKLPKGFFKRHDIRIIESLENGKDYLLFYLKLLTESISHEGELRFSDTIPYNANMLATITNTNVDVVKSAIKLFKELNLLEIWDDETLFLVETSKLLGSESEWAVRKRKYNARKNLEVKSDELPSKYPYKLSNITVLSHEQIAFNNGITRFIDEKRYGGNGKIVLARSNGKCEICKVEASKEDTLIIHHNNGYSNELDDLLVLCKSCHGDLHSRTISYSSPTQFLQEKEIELELDKDIDIKKEKEIKRKKEITPIETTENNEIVDNNSNKNNVIKEIVSYLNYVSGKNYRPNTEKTQRHIKARLNEGFALDDFKKVIDIKVAEWKDTEMELYIRPETLFGNKFESYLQQKIIPNRKEYKENKQDQLNEKLQNFMKEE